jgi:hypothetical protein
MVREKKAVQRSAGPPVKPAPIIKENIIVEEKLVDKIIEVRYAVVIDSSS